MKTLSWWPVLPWRRNGTVAAEPGSRLFSHIRLRLTLLYCGVLATALLLFGLLLYVGVSRMLFTPIHNDLVRRAERLAIAWQLTPGFGCAQAGFIAHLPAPGPGHGSAKPLITLGVRAPVYAACFDATGTIAQPITTAAAPRPFLDNGLALQALRGGSAGDTVDGGQGVGTILRYAEAVPDPTGAGALGVVQVGEPVEGQEQALHALLQLLVILGGVSLLAAAVTGLLLSGRALAPARLAMRRQQHFIAAAAHELRTPLTLLRADAEVLLRGRGRLAAEDAELLEDIVAESAHMSTLATNLLTLARLDSARLHIEQEVVDLSAIAAAGTRRVAALAAEREVTVRTEDEGPVLVLGDRLLLEQALLVLIDNAVKFNRAGGSVVVRSRLHGERALLAVSDTGMGIAPEYLPRLGERFFRADAARTRSLGGAGLGLSIARGILAQHHATLTLTSAPNDGATATMSFTPLDRRRLHV